MSEILKIITFNIWFSPKHFRQRCHHIKKIIDYHQPDMFCLQEVIPNSLHYFQRQFPQYYCSRNQIHDKDYAEVIFSKYEFDEIYHYPLNSQMGRELTVAVINIHGELITLATTHFESLHEYRNLRLKQFDDIFDHLSSYNTVILVGDFNLIGKEEEMIHIPTGWFDIWEQINYSDRWRYTFDHKINRHVDAPYRDRLDRTYYFSTSDLIIPISFKLIGTNPEDGIYPSDHFGIVVQFDMKTN